MIKNRIHYLLYVFDHYTSRVWFTLMNFDHCDCKINEINLIGLFNDHLKLVNLRGMDFSCDEILN